MPVVTVSCADCKWITDLETTSTTNPSVCPECSGTLIVDGTSLEWLEYEASEKDADALLMPCADYAPIRKS